MVNVDMVGAGNEFHVRATRSKPGPIAGNLLELARGLGMKPSYKQAGDIGDHEAFENAGIDTAWLQWRKDPSYHTKGDTISKINLKKLDSTGVLLQTFLFPND